MINGDRVKQARELQGLTQDELADALGVVQGTIARIEKGLLQPSNDLVEALALKTRVKPTFFHRKSAIEFPEGTLLYRANKTVKAKNRAELRRYGQTVLEMVERMASELKEMPVYVQRHTTEAPSEAARCTRADLGLSPDTAIPQLTLRVEKSGVLVLTTSRNIPGCWAFSTWAGRERASERRPVIVLVGGLPGDRQRFTVAHELGHLVMHAGQDAPRGDVEDEANQFARELLLPEAAVREEMELRQPLTLQAFAEMKPRWKVSIQTLIYRAWDFGLVTERQRKYLFERLGVLKWKEREPEHLDVPVEKPRALRKMTEVLYPAQGNSVDYARLAADEGVSIALIREIFDVYAQRKDLPAISSYRSVDRKRQSELRILPENAEA